MRSLHSHYILGLLTLSYLLGELGHFLLGSTSRPMSRELEYGDQACLGPPDCAGQQTEETCLAAGPHCDWNYTGLGLDYQLLAGPTFITVFSVSGVLFGLAADLTHRPRLLGAAVITFSSALLVTSQAGSYWELVLARMLLAAGESACSPVCVSLISDLYPERHRALATAVLHLGVYLGFGLSQAAGIYLTQLDLLGFSWRAPYFLTGVPGIVVGLLLLLLPDPRKTSQGRAKKEELLTELKELKEVKELKELKEVEEVRGGSGLEYLKSTLLTPFMLTMFLAAATRHAAGFTWAYNCRLYFLRWAEGGIFCNTETGEWLLQLLPQVRCRDLFLPLRYPGWSHRSHPGGSHGGQAGRPPLSGSRHAGVSERPQLTSDFIVNVF